MGNKQTNKIDPKKKATGKSEARRKQVFIKRDKPTNISEVKNQIDEDEEDIQNDSLHNELQNVLKQFQTGQIDENNMQEDDKIHNTEDAEQKDQKNDEYILNTEERKEQDKQLEEENGEWLNYSTQFLEKNFQLKTLLSTNTQSLFKFRTHKVVAYPFDYQEEFLLKQFTKLSSFVLEHNFVISNNKEIWQGYKDKNKSRKYIFKIYKGQEEQMLVKYEKKLARMKKFINISSEKVVKTEDLYLSQTDIFGETHQHLVIEVKGATQIHLGDIIQIRRNLKNIMFTESEAYFIFQKLLEIMYQCYKQKIYHSYFYVENVVITCKDSMKVNDHHSEIDPQTFKFDDFFSFSDNTEIKLKEFEFFPYDYTDNNLIISKKKKNKFYNCFYYPNDIRKEINERLGQPKELQQENEEKIYVEDIHKLDVYCLGIVMLSLITLEIPLKSQTVTQIQDKLKKSKSIYPNICLALNLMIKENSKERIDIESLYTYFTKYVQDDDLKKPRMKPFYNKAMYGRLQLQMQKQKELIKEKKDDMLKKRKKGAEFTFNLNESQYAKLNEVSMEIIKANAYILFKNYKQAEIQLKDILKEKGEFLENLSIFTIDDYADLNFHLAYVQMKQFKLKAAQRLLKTLQIDIRKANYEMSIVNLKIIYYLTFNTFILKQTQSTQSNLENLEDLMKSMMILIPNLDQKIIFDYFILSGKIHSVNNQHEIAIKQFSEILKRIDNISPKQKSLVYYYLTVENFELAQYAQMKEYMNKCFQAAKFELNKIEEKKEEDEEEVINQTGSEEDENQIPSEGQHRTPISNSLANVSDKIQQPNNENQEQGEIYYWILMCFGYMIETSDILCKSTDLRISLEKSISLIKDMVINDRNIDNLVNWCNRFGQYIQNDKQFMYIGEFMVIAIMKNIDNMSFDKSYLYNVIGMVYYYSGNVMQAEINFDKSIKNDESQDDKKKKSIYSILSLEWIAYINYYELNNIDKGKKMYDKVMEQYEYFMKAIENKKYKTFITERQMYAFRLWKKDQLMRKNLDILIDLPDRNNADKRYEATITFFHGFYFLQRGNKEQGCKKIDDALMIVTKLFPESHMMSVRWQLLAIIDCLCLDYNDLAIQYAEKCKIFIKKFEGVGEEDEDYSDFYVLYGYTMIISQQFQEAIEIFCFAEKELIEERSINQNDVQIIKRLACAGDIIGRIHEMLGNYYKSFEYLHGSIQYENMASNEESLDQAYRYSALSNVCYYLAYWNSSIEYAQKAKQLFRRCNLKAKKAVNRENFLMILKIFEVQLETTLKYEVDGLMKKMQKKIKNDRDMVGLDDNHDLKAIFHRIQAKFYFKNNDYEKALEELNISYRSYLEFYGPYESITYDILLLKADILLHSQEFGKCYKLLMDIQEGYKTVKIKNIFLQVEMNRLLGRFMIQDNNFEEAKLKFETSFKLLKEISGNKQHPLMGDLYLYIGRCMFALKQDLEDVLGYFQRSLSIYTYYYDSRHKNCPLLLFEMGKIQYTKDKFYKYLRVIRRYEFFQIKDRQFLVKRLVDNDKQIYHILSKLIDHQSLQCNSNEAAQILQDILFQLNSYIETEYNEKEFKNALQSAIKEIEMNLQDGGVLENIQLGQKIGQLIGQKKPIKQYNTQASNQSGDKNKKTLISKQISKQMSNKFSSLNFQQQQSNIDETIDDDDLVLSITLPYYLNDPTLLYFKHAIQIAKLFIDKDKDNDENQEIINEIKEFIEYLKSIFVVTLESESSQSSQSQSQSQSNQKSIDEEKHEKMSFIKFHMDTKKSPPDRNQLSINSILKSPQENQQNQFKQQNNLRGRINF